MSSGDPLFFFLPVLFSFSTSPHGSFLSFFHQILNCLLYLLVRFFFLFVSFSISSVFFLSTCHCINNSLFVFIYEGCPKSSWTTWITLCIHAGKTYQDHSYFAHYTDHLRKKFE